MQVVLWGVFAATLGVAALVVRHKRLVGSVELGGVRSIDLPGGARVGVRLPKGWPVDRDAAEHPGGDDATGAAVAPGEAVPALEAHQPPADEEGADDDPARGRRLVVFWQPVPAGTSAAHLLGRTAAAPAAADADDALGGGSLPMAGGQGAWAGYTVGRSMHPAYAAAVVVPAGPATPAPLAVIVRLDCPPGDPAGDRDLLYRVAASVTVDRDRPPGFAATPAP